MTTARRHHLVPRFYLRRFANADGRLWVFDKARQRAFRSSAQSIAVESGFYASASLQGTPEGPLFLEAQFAALESEAAQVLECWTDQATGSDRVEIPTVNREVMSLYLVTQLLRTAAQRNLLVEFVRKHPAVDTNAEASVLADVADAHARLLCDDVVQALADTLQSFIWVFARNQSGTPFWISDQPVVLEDGASKQWLSTPSLARRGVQLLFPISPWLILYCMEPHHWAKLGAFGDRVSPVEFVGAMVDHENSGQVGMSKRFVFSCEGDFAFARLYCDMHPEIADPDRERLMPA
ncbi:MAG: DUF4238 domain-containing protein [Myxococcales bacterium]|nr:DUF4238 domain-containing protein [Myxococcales bacterium]